MSCKYVLKNDVLLQKNDNNYIAMRENDFEAIFILNEIYYVILSYLKVESLDKQALVSMINDDYDANINEINNDINFVIDECIKLNLLEEVKK